MQHSAPARNWVGDNGKIIEPLFADYFLSLHPMRCFQGRLFTVDGMVEDEAPLKKEIYEQVRYYATTSVARRILRNAAAPMASAILIKTSRVKTATNGKVFPRKRRQQIAKNKSNTNLQTERF